MKRILTLIVVLTLLSIGCLAADFDGYIVKLKENTAGSLSTASLLSGDASLFADMEDAEVASFLADELDEVTEINTDHRLLKVDSFDAVADLCDLGVVEYYEENFYLELFTNDYEANERYSEQWYLDYINASYAWDIGVYGEGVKVGVIDSGVYNHDDLAANLLEGIDYDDDDTTTCNTDEVYNGVGHGTTVAGIIAAQCNDIGHVGIAFKSKIVPMRVINSSGSVSLKDAASAIFDAIDRYGCGVLNLSFGTYKESNTLYDAIMYAINKNVIVVAAAGNNALVSEDGAYNRPQYPAYYEQVVSVANACKSGSGLSIYSSSTYNDGVDIAAPATQIETLNSKNGYTSSRTGTSFSSPMVAAAAALVKSVDPAVTQAEFLELIKSTANTSYIASSGKTSEHWGAGLLDIEAMMKKLISTDNAFASDIVEENGENVVYITNQSTKNSLGKFLISITDYDSQGVPTDTIEQPVSIAAGQTYRLSLTSLGFSSNAVVSVSDARVPGDVSGDDRITVRDATLVLRYIAQYDDGIDADVLDVNGDGRVSVSDATDILRYLAGYDVTFG